MNCKYNFFTCYNLLEIFQEPSVCEDCLDGDCYDSKDNYKTIINMNFKEQIKGTLFEQHLAHEMTVNNSPSSLGYWNLILSIRDVKLFTKGIKIHNKWRLKDVKNYFGITGDKHKVLKQLENYKQILTDES